MIGSGLRDLSLNIIAGLSCLILGASGQRLATAWRFRFQRRVWHPLAGKAGLGVCLTSRPGPLAKSTQRLSLAEVRAVARVIPLITRLGITYRLLESATADAETLGMMNLLVLGSTFVNKVSREIAEYLRPVIRLSISEDPRQITFSDRTYAPEYSSDGTQVVQDYAVVLRVRSPFDETRSRWALVVMGCHGFGTEAATSVVTDKTLIRKVMASVGDKAFAAVLSIRVLGRAYDSDIVEIQSLAHPGLESSQRTSSPVQPP